MPRPEPSADQEHEWAEEDAKRAVTEDWDEGNLDEAFGRFVLRHQSLKSIADVLSENFGDVRLDWRDMHFFIARPNPDRTDALQWFRRVNLQLEDIGRVYHNDDELRRQFIAQEIVYRIGDQLPQGLKPRGLSLGTKARNDRLAD
jgi:hypothetical protein